MHKRSFVPLGAATAVALALFSIQPDLALFAADTKPDAKALAAAEAHRRLEWFADALQSVQRHYVEDRNDSQLIEAAISGMLSTLEGSSYIEPRFLHDVQGCTTPTGCGGGLGVELTIEDGWATIVTPIDDSPAAKADLMAGDVIARIDDDPTQGLALQHVAEKLHGPAGSMIQLTIIRPGKDKLIELSLVRDEIRARQLRSRVDGDIGYIRIGQFNERTGDQLQKAIVSIRAQIPAEILKGYVIDLRNNANGLLNEAVSVASAFLSSGEIVSIRGRTAGEEQHFRATGIDLTGGKPVIVLLNGGSASMAEVVAAALQDHRRATIVGTRSFGMGAVYTLIPAGSGKDAGAIRLATGHYVTPLSHVIQGRGIWPDVEVRQDIPDDLIPSRGRTRPVLQSYVPPDPKGDKALITAYSILRGTSANAASNR